jgi:glycosyltransferase involved in cell wall biosynthesis
LIPIASQQLNIPTIHLWVPEIRDGGGGIQALSREYITAIRSAFPSHGIRVLVKNDALALDDCLRGANISFHSTAGCPRLIRTLAFALLGLWFGLRDKPVLTLAMHLHFLPATGLLKPLLAPFNVCVLHGIEVWQKLSFLRLTALRAADKLIAVSQHTGHLAIGMHSLNANRVTTVPNTFNTGRFHPGPKPQELLSRFNLRPEQPILLTVSRLDPSERYKGHLEVLRSLQMVRERFPEIRYLIGGTGSYQETLEKHAQELGVRDLVIFTGFIPNEELCAHYQLCDVFVMPSQKEGFGIVFLEAMACGKPVIAGNQDGSVDALDGGRLGVLVDPNEVSQITAAIVQILSRDHPNRLLFDPQGLNDAVNQTFGREAFTRRVHSALLPFLQSPSVPTDPPQSPSPSKELPRPIRITVLTQLTSPYQVEFLNEVATLENCDLTVVYLTSQDRERHWTLPEIKHRHLILDVHPKARHTAMHWLLEADVTVFNYYTHPFAARALLRRAATHQPWVFWGERPGALQLGWLGSLTRQVLLLPLFYKPHPIWGVGRFALEGYVKEFGDARPYVNLPYFSNLNRFLSSPRDRKPEGIRFLYCGTLSKRKGVDLLATAFLELALENPDVRLVLVGTGPLEDDLRTSLAPVADRVEFSGFAAWDELPAAYQKGDVFCFPSRYDGWGLALVEAMASGLPVISTDLTGAALEFVTPGENGWLIPHGDLSALLQAMRESMHADLDQMGQAACQAVRDHSLPQGAKRFLAAATAALPSSLQSTRTSLS